MSDTLYLQLDQIHDRHYITSWFIRVKIYNRHHPEPIQDFTVVIEQYRVPDMM